jgi:hypothetical protein
MNCFSTALLAPALPFYFFLRTLPDLLLHAVPLWLSLAPFRKYLHSSSRVSKRASASGKSAISGARRWTPIAPYMSI